MSGQIQLEENQIQGFEIFLKLGEKRIQSIIREIHSSAISLLEPEDLQDAIQRVIQDLNEDSRIITNQLMYLYNIKRASGIDAKELLNALESSIKNAENPWEISKINELKKLEPTLVDLFSISKISYIVKAISLSFDYTNLAQSIKILTDIRPVYNEDAKEIVGEVITHTLRLYYQGMEGQKSISITLDTEDIKMLGKSCKRALTKERTAQLFMKDKLSKQNIES